MWQHRTRQHCSPDWHTMTPVCPGSCAAGQNQKKPTQKSHQDKPPQTHSWVQSPQIEHALIHKIMPRKPRGFKMRYNPRQGGTCLSLSLSPPLPPKMASNMQYRISRLCCSSSCECIDISSCISSAEVRAPSIFWLLTPGFGGILRTNVSTSAKSVSVPGWEFFSPAKLLLRYLAQWGGKLV